MGKKILLCFFLILIVPALFACSQKVPVSDNENLFFPDLVLNSSPLAESDTLPEENIPHPVYDKKTDSKFVGTNYSPVIDSKEKVIALTFDDGPNYRTTPKLLEALKERDVKVTFFVVGSNISGNEEILQKMIEYGCEIGIHSFGHANYYKMTVEEVMADIKHCSELIEGATGIVPILVRPPYGNIQDEIVKAKDYYYINWCVDPVDWKADSKESIVEHIKEHTSSGSIVLLHDIHKMSCDAAIDLIDQFKADGWRFVTVSELFDLKNNESSGKIYYFR